MERTVPSTASDEVELYLRTYYSLLRTTAEVQIRTLEEAHSGMNSLLHPAAREMRPDMSAFIYSLLRLPDCMFQVERVVLGQSSEVFIREGVGNVDEWQPATTRARRRRCYFNGKGTLACFIASRSDIDDVIPLLTAYQIEWNKIHNRLSQLPRPVAFSNFEPFDRRSNEIAEVLQISPEDLYRLRAIWKKDFSKNMARIASNPRRLKVQLLSGSLSEYRRATHAWWMNIEQDHPELLSNPVYFVSSNTHCLPNLLSGFAEENRERLDKFVRASEDTDLHQEWEQIQAREVPSSEENFLFYLMKKFQQSAEGSEFVQTQGEHEKEHGIWRIPSPECFDIEAQVIQLSNCDIEGFDRRLSRDSPESLSFLKESDAVILNIDYPLGLAAYNILSKVSEQVSNILGVYIMGKAATLNGVVGDLMIPNVNHDEHSKNTYLFNNCFSAEDISPFLKYGTVLDNQKAVTVRGTFLQNNEFMDVFYREGYTDIEMEAGAYLSAVYEMYRPKRHPVNEIVNLYNLPFDLGMIHYASDTPLSKGKNLGAGSLSYFGMDSTYASAVAILRRIFFSERQRLSRTR